MLYSVLIYAVDGVFDRLPAEEQSSYIAKHAAVQEKLKANGTYRGAARLMPAATAVTVKSQGDKVLVTDGPFAETKEQFAGFYVLEADTMDEAIEAAKMLPQGIAQMEVRPIHWASGVFQGS
jgi:hypothetical protein